MDHNTERMIKLAPYPILDTDPVLIRNKMTNNAIQSMFDVEPTERDDDVFLHHHSSRRWKDNEKKIKKEKFKNIDRHNYPNIKKCSTHKTQPSVNCQRKVKKSPPIDHNTERMIKLAPYSILDTDPVLIQNKMTNNSIQLEEMLLITNQDNKISINNNDIAIPKSESLNIDDTHEKSSVKLLYTKIKKLAIKPKRKFNVLNNTSMFSVNTQNNNLINLSMELTSEDNQTSLKSTMVQVLNKNKENDMSYKLNKSAFDNLFSVSDNQKHEDIFEQHSALRSSLFSNMPPYIRFFSYDTKGKSFPLSLQKELKWKLNCTTPIVVHRIIKNSGFKLVRSEHSLIDNANDPSVISNPSNQNVISLQNYCGITPPIIDTFCGSVPSPNELLMLPRSQSDDWVGTWGKHTKSLRFKLLHEQQKINHFPGTFEIGRKDKLWKNLHRLILKYGKDQFGIIPTSYILPQEARLLRQVWEKNDEDKWIVKPPASARGIGIRVISKWSQIPQKVPLVIQRYIDNPYLINNTKFDLRLYILITSINPLKLYLYDNGLVRFASVKYSTDLTTISDRYMHLTNYSINRLSSEYTTNEDADACKGHKWTLKSLWKYMEKEHKIDVKKLWDSLGDLVIKTVLSGESPMSKMCHLNLNNRYNAYELFGIDVLLDEYLKPWILEVNISPSLHSTSPLDLAVKGPLVKDLLNMVGFHIPNKMSPSTHNTLLKLLGVKSPLCYDKRLYTFNLTVEEYEKHEYFKNIESREQYIDSILDNLLSDDVRYLMSYEDELTQIGSFQKIFPTTTSYIYHKYFDGPRYYNMLFDAWECKYSNKREEGIAMLEELCELKIHLKVPDIVEEQSEVIFEI